MPIAYIFADLIYFLLYRVVGYRRKVVRKNLRDSFPDASTKWLSTTERRFYRNFADSLMEALCLPLLSDKAMLRRMKFENVELIDNFIKEGQSVAIYFAHTFNWEWAPAFCLHSEFHNDPKVVFGQVYRPLKSKFFDHLMLRLRSRFHSVSYPKSNTLRHLIKARRDGITTVTGFMSDQHPSHGDQGHLTTLLNHPTLMITGTETLASRLKMAAVYWDMEKLARGHYRITIRPISNDASAEQEGAITEKYARMLETTVLRQPEIWLWSHNRWKRPINQPAPTQSRQ